MLLPALLSPITSRDIPLYREFFARDWQIACYGNSWAYITQACRGFGLGLKYYEPDLLVSIGRHRGHYVIVRPLGSIDGRFIALLATLRKTSGKPIFIKKLFPNQVARLRQLGNFHEAATYESRTGKVFAGKYPWDPVAFADDDTYPELILDVDITKKHWLKPRDWFDEFQKARRNSDSDLPSTAVREHYRKFRHNVHQFLRLDIGCRLEAYTKGDVTAVGKLLSRYFGEERLPNVEAYNNMLISFHTMIEDELRFGFTAHVDGIASPVGFFLGERLDRKSVGSYARVVSRCYPGFPGVPWRLHYVSTLAGRNFSLESRRFRNGRDAEF